MYLCPSYFLMHEMCINNPTQETTEWVNRKVCDSKDCVEPSLPLHFTKDILLFKNLLIWKAKKQNQRQRENIHPLVYAPKCLHQLELGHTKAWNHFGSLTWMAGTKILLLIFYLSEAFEFLMFAANVNRKLYNR